MNRLAMVVGIVLGLAPGFALAATVAAVQAEKAPAVAERPLPAAYPWINFR